MNMANFIAIRSARIFIFLLSALLVSACGGSGSGGSTNKLMPWQEKAHSGDVLTIELKSPTEAEISWINAPGETYDLYISRDPETDLSNYASYGAELRQGVVSPVMLNDLVAGEAVYIALIQNDSPLGWSSFATGEWGIGGVNRTVSSQAISDNGTRYIGGDFSQVSLVTGHGVGLSAAMDAPHALAFPQVSGDVESVIADGNGGWYIGGRFVRVGDQDRMRLAQIDRAGRLTDWSPVVTSGAVQSLALGDGILYVGGTFDAIDGQQRLRLAAFDTADGSLTDWNPGANNSVNTLAVADGVIYAGGMFTEAGAEGRDRLAAFDTDGALIEWNPGVDGAVHSLVTAGGVVYAGGSFTQAGTDTGGEARARLAAFDTDGVVTAWNPGASSTVNSLFIADGVIYAGGSFSEAAGEPRSYLAAFDMDGDLRDWSAATGFVVYALTVADGVIYTGGGFSSASGQSRANVAAFDLSGNLTDWNPGANYTVRSLAVAGNVVYVGGRFSAAGMGRATRSSRLAVFDAEGNLSDWNPVLNGSVTALALADDILYVGGQFTSIDGRARTRLAAFDTADNSLTDWNPAANDKVDTLLVADDVIYAGGRFTEVGSGAEATVRNRLAAFTADGNLKTWNPGADKPVQTLALVNALQINGNTVHVLAVGGQFTEVGGVTRNRLAMLGSNQDGALGWTPNIEATTSSRVSALAVSDGIIYAAGRFNEVNGEVRKNLAAFSTGNGSLTDWAAEASGLVEAMAVADGVIYVGGLFLDDSRSRLAAFDNAGVMTNWNPGANNGVNSLVVADGVIYAGGSFTAAGNGASALNGGVAAFDVAGALVVGH